MTRAELQHLIRAAADIASDDEMVVVGGRQAILGQFPHAPAPLRVSVEANLFPLHHPAAEERATGNTRKEMKVIGL